MISWSETATYPNPHIILAQPVPFGSVVRAILEGDYPLGSMVELHENGRWVLCSLRGDPTRPIGLVVSNWSVRLLYGPTYWRVEND